MTLIPLRLDLRHLHLRVILPVAEEVQLPLALAVDRSAHLVRLAMREHLHRNRCAGDEGRPDRDGGLVLGNEHYLVEGHGLARLGLDERHLDLVPLGNLLLEAGDGNDCEHDRCSVRRRVGVSKTKMRDQSVGADGVRLSGFKNGKAAHFQGLI